MGAVLTTRSSVTCPSSGTVGVDSTAKLTVGGKPVLVKASVANKTITGCKQINTQAGEVQCVTASVSKGEAGKLKAGGDAVLLADTFVGSGGGSPLSMLSANAMQKKLTAV